ncbi:DUF4157 domain-containing protein [Pendulispora rubella]|uniref:DUF4157 domain-containing protein n=1 Tax=Pendulispora rubella TaxID=2741070 RepID=A0ABZ2KS37_9BACT
MSGGRVLLHRPRPQTENAAAVSKPSAKRSRALDPLESFPEIAPRRVDFSRVPAHSPMGPLSHAGGAMQRKAMDGATAEAPAAVERVLRSPGHPLGASTREFMEPRFGHDFGTVRIHDDAEAHGSAQAVRARAYTMGHHVVFNAGQYRPETAEGRKLLAHELVHTVQQGASSNRIARKPLDEASDSPEARAETERVDALEQRYREELVIARLSGRWQLVAEVLNAFSPDDIRARLVEFSNADIQLLHLGALTNPKLGPKSNVALLSDRDDPNNALAPRLSPSSRKGVRPVAEAPKEVAYALNPRLRSKDYLALLVESRRTNRWQKTAEALNAFNEKDILLRLMPLTVGEIHSMYIGAVTNPKLGPYSNVAKLTVHGLPRASKEEPLATTLAPEVNQSYSAVDPEPIVLDNKLLPKEILVSFGVSVAKGAALIALAGLAVGSGGVLAGVAYAALWGLGTYGFVQAYSARRQEIEAGNYDVSVVESGFEAAGDVVGFSQLVEGITGQRLGTEALLDSQTRSEQLGEGVAGIALTTYGGRLFQAAEVRGRSLRSQYSTPRRPSGPNGNEQTPLPTDTVPNAPVGNPDVNSFEYKLWEQLPTSEERIGFSYFMEKQGAAREITASKMDLPRARRVAQDKYAVYQKLVEKGEAAERKRARANDDPLDPQLAYNEYMGDNVISKYESKRSPEREILFLREVSFFREIAKRTGWPIEAFGDTASKIDYPGIDGVADVGTLRKPNRRPVSLKDTPSTDATEAVRLSKEAIEKAAEHSYSDVFVEIKMGNLEIKEVQSAWNLSIDPRRLLSQEQQKLRSMRIDYLSKNIAAQITFTCKDGIWAAPRASIPAGFLPLSGEEKNRAVGGER